MYSISIYSAEFRDQLSERVFARLLSDLPEACRKRALAARRWQDALGIVISRQLLKRALEDMGAEADLHRLQYSALGRPFLEEGPEFNWSHSETRVVCAISRDSRVGIDIEYIRPLELSPYRDSFPPDEWDRMMSSEDPTWHFYQEWTGKEAVLKADGRGLSGNMKNVIKVNQTETVLDQESWFTHEVSNISEDYACHLASKLKTPVFLHHDVDISV